jgi:hypothetical protein
MFLLCQVGLRIGARLIWNRSMHERQALDDIPGVFPGIRQPPERIALL